MQRYDKVKKSLITWTLIAIFCRAILGPDLTFIHFEMSQEDKKKRLLKRHEAMRDAEKFSDKLDVTIFPLFTVFPNDLI